MHPTKLRSRRSEIDRHEPEATRADGCSSHVAPYGPFACLGGYQETDPTIPLRQFLELLRCGLLLSDRRFLPTPGVEPPEGKKASIRRMMLMSRLRVVGLD
jgi:hypothetical protein